MAKLNINNLHISYENEGNIVEAINNLSTVIPDKKITVIIGKSGCGKTTLLKAILGLIKIDSGSIFVDENDISNITTQNRNFSYISQNVVLFPHLTIFDNIALPLKEKKVKSPLIYEKIKQISKIFEIDKLLSRKPKQLSAGQQQKVLLAKSLIKDSKLYLFDEPFANLDDVTRRKLRMYLRCYQEENELSIIFVTHKIDEAISLADNLIVMDEGKIVAQGNPQDIYDFSTEKAVKDLIEN